MGSLIDRAVWEAARQIEDLCNYCEVAGLVNRYLINLKKAVSRHQAIRYFLLIVYDNLIHEPSHILLCVVFADLTSEHHITCIKL